MSGLSRRDFLKLVALTAAVATVSKAGIEPLLLKESKKRTLLEGVTKVPRLEERYFFCKICEAGCVLKGFIEKKSNKIVKFEGDPRDWVSHGTPCVKGKTVLKMLYDPNRLKTPLKRTNPDRGFVLDKNGSLISVKDPKWVKISWDEALDLIAEKIAEAIKTLGPQSVVFIGHGKGSALADLIGTPNVVKHHTTCHSTWDTGLRPMFGGLLPVADMANSKLIISFGFDQGAGKSKNPFAWSFAEAKRNGTKIIVFEPRLSETANKATEWIPIKPGTDIAVALAMANVIIENNLYDKEFLLKYTNAPLLIDSETKTYVKDEKGNLLVYDEFTASVKPLNEAKSPALIWNGYYNGKSVGTAFYFIKERISHYTPEWAEKISGVSASKIREIAWEFATTKPASIPHWKRSGGTGPGRQQGIETYKVISLLMVLTGNIEKRGGWIFDRKAKFITKAVSKKPKKKFSDLYPIPEKYKGKYIDEREKFPVYKKYLNEGVYQKVWYNILNDNPYPVKVLIIWAQSLQSTTDYSLVEKAIRHVVEDNKGIVVNVNIYPDEMATLADIVLPEKFFLEGGPSIGFSNSFDITYRISWVDGIEPLYPDVKSEGWITKQLAYKIGEKLGISKDVLEREYFSEYFLISSEEKLRKMLDLYNKKLGTNVTLEKLEKEKVFSVSWRPLDLSKVKFKTPSGRIEILMTELAENGYDPLPIWKDTFTYQGPLKTGELVVVSSVFSMNRHEKTVNNEWLRYFLAKQHADSVWIHPSVASKLGIKDGDLVIVEFVRSFNPSITIQIPKFKLLAKAHVTEAVRPDVIFIPHGTGQISPFMDSYHFGPRGGDGVIKPVMLDYNNPSAAASDQDIIVRVRPYG